jgi:NitT/TauT family transport system substrate-binding protein
MRRLFILSLCLSLIGILTACQSDTDKISMMVPFGSPQLATLYLENNKDHYDVDIVSGPDMLISAFSSLSHDVIIAPTNLGARLYQSGSPYQLLASIVWGNFYIVSLNVDLDSITDLNQKSITVFGQNQTSDIIIKYIIESLNLDVTIDYVDSVSTALGMLISNQSDIIMIAEPSLSVLRQTQSNLNIIDLQDVYQSITGTSSYPQAGVFVHKDLSKSKINRLKADLDASIALVNQNPELAGLLAETLKVGLSAQVIESAIPNSHLNYVSAQDSKSAIITYFELILSLNPNLIGGQLPDDGFYYA